MRNASSLAAMARWMKRPILRASFLSSSASGSKCLTSAAIWQAKAEASKLVIFSTPLFPASNDCHVSSASLPTAQIMPIPVTTTRRLKLFRSLRVCVDVIDGVLHGADLLRILIGNLDFKSLFEGHHQLDRIERVRAQVVNEGSVRRNLRFIHAQLLHDNLLYP